MDLRTLLVEYERMTTAEEDDQVVFNNIEKDDKAVSHLVGEAGVVALQLAAVRQDLVGEAVQVLGIGVVFLFSTLEQSFLYLGGEPGH